VTNGPAYRRVADDLRVRIRSGQLAQGQRLASLPQLAAEYEVSPDVARQAISILRAEGLIETQQGRGAFVREFSKIARVSPSRLSKNQWGSGKAIQDRDTDGRWRTVDVVVSEVPAPEDIAADMEVEPGAPLLCRARRFLVDERPVQLASSYYPLDIVRGSAITYTDTGAGGAYARLAELGYAPARFVERVIDRTPRPEEAFDLALPKSGARVFDITRVAITSEGRRVEVNRMVLDAAAYVLEYHFNA
jgi:GntR family transcriptional regulator